MPFEHRITNINKSLHKICYRKSENYEFVMIFTNPDTKSKDHYIFQMSSNTDGCGKFYGNYYCDESGRPPFNPESKTSECIFKKIEYYTGFSDDDTDKPKYDWEAYSKLTEEEEREFWENYYDEEDTAGTVPLVCESFIGKAIDNIRIYEHYNQRGYDFTKKIKKMIMTITFCDGRAIHLVFTNEHNGYYPQDVQLQLYENSDAEPLTIVKTCI